MLYLLAVLAFLLVLVVKIIAFALYLVLVHIRQFMYQIRLSFLFLERNEDLLWIKLIEIGYDLLQILLLLFQE